jgi:hypothetical protein
MHSNYFSADLAVSALEINSNAEAAGSAEAK